MSMITEILQSSRGNTHIVSVGQAGFIIITPTGKFIGIDLYLSDFSEKHEGHKGFKRLLPKLLKAKDIVFDYLIATHPHSDHFDYDSMSELMNNGHTQLYASCGCRELSEQLHIDESRITYVKPGDVIHAVDCIINFVNCDHGCSAPDALGVVVSTGGLNIYETGDTSLRLDGISEVLSIGHIDVLIGPINGTFGNMNEREFSQLSKELKPSLTIPCHYGMFSSQFGHPGRFIEYMGEICPQNKYLVMAQGELLTL